MRKNKQTKQTSTSYPLAHAFVEDTIRHNIARMTSTSKAYITCFLVIIIMLSHDHMRQTSTPLWSLKITQKTCDTRG